MGRTRANSTVPSPRRSRRICILRNKFPALSLKLTGVITASPDCVGGEARCRVVDRHTGNKAQTRRCPHRLKSSSGHVSTSPMAPV